jgi:hypothetical protein
VWASQLMIVGSRDMIRAVRMTFAHRSVRATHIDLF